MAPGPEGQPTRPSPWNFPAVDVIDQGKYLLLRAEVPGVPRELLEVSVDEWSVTLRGQRPDREPSADYLRSERVSGRFSRTVPLPAPVEARDTRAHLENGILELTLKKSLPRTRRARAH